MKLSNAVNKEIRALYAILAAAAARKAVNYVEEWSNAEKANVWAEHAVDWLTEAGAEATKWTYRRPSYK